MNEFLIQALKKTQNKTIDLYDRYNTRINSSSVEMCIMAELKENISKKIQTNVMLNLSNIYNKISSLASSDSKFDSKEEIQQNINSMLELQKGLEVYFNNSKQNLINLSFEEDFNNSLKQIFKTDFVYNQELRVDLVKLFNSECNNLKINMDIELKKYIELVQNECKIMIEQEIKELSIELDKYEKNNAEQKEENNIVETEKKDAFIKARESQREQDKIDRAKQIEARNMVYNNQENQLEEKGRTL